MAWADANNSGLDSLFLLQKRVIRTCTNSLWLAHTDPLFSSMNTLKIYDIYKLQLASFMYQFENNMLPDDLIKEDFFNTITLTHNYETRHAHYPIIKTTHTVLANNTPMSQGPLLWSNLDPYLKTSPSLISFKRNLKKSLISMYDTVISP